MKIKLNKVDRHIKTMMMTYPAIYPSRIAVLQHIFLVNGNGFDWGSDGCPTMSSYGVPAVTAMDYSDLHQRISTVKEDIARETLEPMSVLLNVRHARLHRELANRQMVEDDIDLYATNHVMQENLNFNASALKHFSTDWCLLSPRRFPQVMDRDWALAAEEMMNIAQQAIFRELGIYSPHYKEENADEKLLKMYREIGTILDKLNQFTGSKDKQAELNELSSRLIDEILAEEAAAKDGA
jgi:hypothetical protein